MAIVVKNTNYNGEVLEQILTVASTGNDLVAKGLIMVIPGVEKKISLPRLKAGKMLRKRKANPTVDDSKGDFEYSEKSLDPKDFMAFSTFNPRTFENIWRPYQPNGNLVFAELPPVAQNALLEALSKQVQFELGWHYVNGEYVNDDNDDEHLMDGILTQAAKDTECIVVDASKCTTMLSTLKAIRNAIPKAMRQNPNLTIVMSPEDFDRYDDELSEYEHKHSDQTEVNQKRYKSIPIEVVSSWPEGVIVATLCSPDADGNLFAGVNLQDDEAVIQIDKVSNMSELYFVKLLMKADTNIAFGEEFVVADTRDEPQFKVPEKTITATPTALTFAAAGESKSVIITASGDYTVGATPAGFTVTKTAIGLTVTATANDGAAARSGSIELTLDADTTKKATITLSQPKA